jgi:hypothetical protein
MCAGLGATGDGLVQCRADEASAAEYVAAWFGFNGFVSNGAIDMEQVQLMASLDYDDPLSVEHGAADPLSSGEPEIDPTTGEAVEGAFQSPAQLAMTCLGSSNDWLKLHDCLAQNGAPGGPGAFPPDPVTGDAEPGTGDAGPSGPPGNEGQ